MTDLSCKVLAVKDRTNTQSGEVTYFVELERTVTFRINFKTAAQLENKRYYQALIGKEVSIPVRQGKLDDGTDWVAFDGDGLPRLFVDVKSMLSDVSGQGALASSNSSSDENKPSVLPSSNESKPSGLVRKFSSGG